MVWSTLIDIEVTTQSMCEDTVIWPKNRANKKKYLEAVTSRTT